jgi:thiol-disulfide isomerase/thioredoxin
LRGALLIALFFAVLYFVPEVFRTKTYRISDPTEVASTKASISLTEPLELILKGENGKLRLGDKKTLEQYIKESHRPLLVNFWATWCPPCLEEMPSLESLGRKLGQAPELPLLVTVSVDEALPEIEGLFKSLDFKMTFPILFDRGGKFASRWGSTKFPETYLFSKEGKLLHKWLGPQDWLSHEVLSQLAKLTVIK